jgi:hypothetical protein
VDSCSGIVATNFRTGGTQRDSPGFNVCLLAPFASGRILPARRAEVAGRAPLPDSARAACDGSRLDGLFSARLRLTGGPMGAVMRSGALGSMLAREEVLPTRPLAHTHG